MAAIGNLFGRHSVCGLCPIAIEVLSSDLFKNRG
jgi:hypothetical protein